MDRYRASQMSQKQKRRVRQLVAGNKKFKNSLQLSHEELRDGVKSFDKSRAEYTVHRTTRC